MEKKKNQPEKQISDFEKKYRALKMRDEVKDTASHTRMRMAEKWEAYQREKEAAKKYATEAAKYKDAVETKSDKKNATKVELTPEQALEKEERKREYERLMKLADDKSKRASKALKMWRFHMRTYGLAERFIELLDDMQAFDEMFQLLEATQGTFHSILSNDYTGVTKEMKKDLRRFKTMLKKSEQQSDRLIEYMDSMFEDKPNVFVRFWNWLTKKESKSSWEALLASENSLVADMAQYKSMLAEEQGEEPVDTPTSGGDDFGAF